MASTKLDVVRRRIVNPYANSAPVLVALVTLGLALKALEVPSKEAWVPDGHGTIAVAVLGVIATVASWLASQTKRRSERDAKLYEACVQIAAQIDELCPDVPLKDVGIHVWLVRGHGKRQRLERGPQFVLRNRPKSGIRFTPGKGVVGRAWIEKADVLLDLEREVHPYAGARENYARLPADVRLGMEWDEYRRTMHHQAIWASALVDDGKVLGVVSVDISAPVAFDQLVAAVGNQHIRTVLASCQDALRSRN